MGVLQVRARTVLGQRHQKLEKYAQEILGTNCIHKLVKEKKGKNKQNKQWQDFIHNVFFHHFSAQQCKYLLGKRVLLLHFYMKTSRKKSCLYLLFYYIDSKSGHAKTGTTIHSIIIPHTKISVNKNPTISIDPCQHLVDPVQFYCLRIFDPFLLAIFLASLCTGCFKRSGTRNYVCYNL